MAKTHLLTSACAVIGMLVASAPAAAQGDDTRVELILRWGTPLRIAVDKTVAVKSIGQTVTGTLVQPVYAYDRLVLPAGTPVVGHVASLENPSRLARLRAWSAGDFAPNRHATIQFDSLTRDGETISLQTLGLNGMSNVRRHVAAGTKTQPTDTRNGDGTLAKGRQELKQKAQDSMTAAKQQVSEAIASPAPSSILRARLTTTLDSATATRGSPVEAVVTEPVLSAGHQLIIPEGTRLIGEVTVARQARWVRRNGSLRFLFERAEMPQREATLLASLQSVDVSADEHVTVDEEGGARATNSKTRFVAPALAVLALAGAGDGEEHPVSPKHPNGGGGNPGAMSLGGVLGFSVIGAAVAPLSQPLGLALAITGVARTTYSSVVGKGHDVRFDADTPIELELAPGPAPPPSAK
jgi:hypothetical protein